MALVRKTYVITATEDTIRKLEALLALMHYNGGHSGTFGMDFDGDGHERLKVEPAPDESFRRLVHLIGGSGAAVEVAGEHSYRGIHLDRKRGRWLADTAGLHHEDW